METGSETDTQGLSDKPDTDLTLVSPTCMLSLKKLFAIFHCLPEIIQCDTFRVVKPLTVLRTSIVTLGVDISYHGVNDRSVKATKHNFEN